MVLSTAGFSQLNNSFWNMHVIDDEGFGADGVKLWQNDYCHVFTVSWEQSGESRCYVFDKNMKYGHTTAVASKGVEDAIVADLNADNIPEIISFMEKPGNSIRISYPVQNWLKEKSAEFNQKDIVESKGEMWMFGTVADINGDGLNDIIAGSKGENASVTVFFQTKHQNWEKQKISDAGWIMTLELFDMDTDGDLDIFISDRKGEISGVKWLENPGITNIYKAWPKHLLGLKGKEPMFAHVQKNKNSIEVYASEISEGVTKFTLDKGKCLSGEKLFDLPQIGGTRLKDICTGNIDNDDADEIILSFEGAKEKYGVIFSKLTSKGWQHFPVSNTKGIKFDLSLLFDMDCDGDLDILNTEENNNSSTDAGLGFIWYENPKK